MEKKFAPYAGLQSNFRHRRAQASPFAPYAGLQRSFANSTA